MADKVPVPCRVAPYIAYATHIRCHTSHTPRPPHFPHTLCRMPQKRYYDAIHDGAPGDDDARYGSGNQHYGWVDTQPAASSSALAMYAPAAAPAAVSAVPVVPAADETATALLPYDPPEDAELTADNSESYTYIVTREMMDALFREVDGRLLNTMQPLYQLPVDYEEVKASRRSSPILRSVPCPFPRITFLPPSAPRADHVRCGC